MKSKDGSMDLPKNTLECWRCSIFIVRELFITGLYETLGDRIQIYIANSVDLRQTLKESTLIF